MSTTPTLIVLNCYVLGDEPKHAFPIQIDVTENFSTLKEAIWAEQPSKFQHVEPENLNLWAVSIPLDHGFSGTSMVPQDGQELSMPCVRIEQIFRQVHHKSLQVLIERPPPPPRSLTINCHLVGDKSGRVFPVRSDTSQDVGALRDAIKFKKSATLRGVDSSALLLWRVLLPTSKVLESVKNYNFDDEEPLPSEARLSQFFLGTLADDCVHILVRVRSIGATVPMMTERPKLYIEQVAPSSLAKAQEFRSFQCTDMYYECWHPPDREPDIPLVLLDPVFATFIEESRSKIPTRQDYAAVSRLRRTMCKFYNDKNERASTLCDEFLKYGIAFSTTNIGECISERHKACNQRPVLILEVKNEIGLGVAEPSIQAMAYYSLLCARSGSWKEATSYHPCFIIFLVGPHLGIGGCALTGRPTIEIFSFLPLAFPRSDDEAYDVLACHLSALKAGVDSLSARYCPLPIPGGSLPSQDQCGVFPYPTTFVPLSGPDGGRRVGFSYTGGGQRANSLVFTGKLENRRIWIKFVRRYGEEVHRWCSDRGFAPRFLGFERLMGGWLMVIMEHLDDSWVRLLNRETHREELRIPIQDAITRLHEEGHMVHGDIRSTNIMVKKTQGSEFMLVDFDWAGKIGEVSYPKFINTDSSIGRPLDVEDCKPILPEHDDHMFRYLFS